MLSARDPRTFGPWGVDVTVQQVLNGLLAAAEHNAWGDKVLTSGSILWVCIEDVTPTSVTRRASKKVDIPVDATVRQVLNALLGSGAPALAFVVQAGWRVDIVPYIYSVGETTYECPTGGSSHFSWDKPGWCPHDGQALVAVTA